MAKYSQTTIPRETRLLLITVLVSVVALWLLARLRFQERPVTADPVPPVLAQLRPPSSFDNLARVVADLRSSVGTWIFALHGRHPALRIGDNAVTLAPVEDNLRVAFDRPTGLTIVRTEAADSSGPLPWVPRVLDYPRYLIATAFVDGRLALRPEFISALFPIWSTLWEGELWRVPQGSAIRPGTFVFTTEGAMAGLAVTIEEGIALVPATHLLRTVEQMLTRRSREPGAVGVAVQPLTPALAAATGATSGMVVTVVDADGPAAEVLYPTDVIEAVDGEVVASVDAWRARTERRSVGDSILLRVRRAGAVQDVRLTAGPASRDADGQHEKATTRTPALGLRLRTISGVGVEVIAVEPLSSAGIAGVRPGDVITFAGELRGPTGAQLISAFRSLDESRALLVALTRGDEHHVLALSK